MTSFAERKTLTVAAYTANSRSVSETLGSWRRNHSLLGLKLSSVFLLDLVSKLTWYQSSTGQ